MSDLLASFYLILHVEILRTLKKPHNSEIIQGLLLIWKVNTNEPTVRNSNQVIEDVKNTKKIRLSNMASGNHKKKKLVP